MYHESTLSAPRTSSTAPVVADLEAGIPPAVPSIPEKRPRLELSDWMSRPEGRIGRMSFSGVSDERVILEDDSCSEFVIIREPVVLPDDHGPVGPAGRAF